jgi:16S rRNA processing protein RimM
MEDLIIIAKVAKTRGLSGELVADILTDFPDRFNNLKKVFAVKPSGETLELEIEKFWFQKGRIIFKFVGLKRRKI